MAVSCIIKGYFIAYVDRITVDEAPYRWTVKGGAHMHFVDSLDIHASTKHIWALPLTEAAIRRFKHSNAIKIRNGMTFDFYTGLPQIQYTAHYATHCLLVAGILIMKVKGPFRKLMSSYYYGSSHTPTLYRVLFFWCMSSYTILYNLLIKSCFCYSGSYRWRRRLSVTNYSSENNSPTFWLNAPVVIMVATVSTHLHMNCVHLWTEYMPAFLSESR